MNNAAFADDATVETARVLRDLADRIENGIGTIKIRDINGNAIGYATFYEESGQ